MSPARDTHQKTISIIKDLLELLTLINNIFIKLMKQSIYCLMSPLHNQSKHPLSQTTSLLSCRPSGLNYSDIHSFCLPCEMEREFDWDIYSPVCY